MLLLTDTEFSLDQRVGQELARLREGDCQIGRMAFSLRNVRNSFSLSFVFLIILSVALALRGQVHIDLFLLAGSLVVCGIQFRRFQRLFREFVYSRTSPAELTASRGGNLDSFPMPLAMGRSRQTAPLSVTEQTTMSLALPGSRFEAVALHMDEAGQQTNYH